MPICRATDGGLFPVRRLSLSESMMRKIQQPYTDRARRKVREIALAIVLTLAAALFLFAALHRQASETAAVNGKSPVVQTTN